mmetsp:Transcript_23967/g.67006  ORF Transcript_23967/g.67006 Transcript_23967/m.67006 type:complete len:115 (-) Transcript_23967:649-993(-)|eukprot:CAMPEP_0198119084 /NCGR_PEP_ID=MMETSP1442-20131203/24274_1 /TAXON_ID= /ORGANISM="Craspedostauros australis, Strain CCMP3328" /LENGTH=114 /DNA_ID=CAMNT_0043777477 /DNA_START=75 /DNA_END=419 /DNA_ORIENTATION=+
MTTTISTRAMIVATVVGLCLISAANAFVPMQTFATANYVTSEPSLLSRPAFVPSSSIDVAVSTLDPSTILSDILGGLIGTPIILLVPIVAALSIAGLVAYLIISYASPQVEDDE